MSEEKYIIISKDSMQFQVDRQIIDSSPILQNEISKNSGTIQLKKITSTMLRNIINFVKISHANENIEVVKVNFINKLNGDDLNELIIASHYLEMKKLLNMLSDRMRELIEMSPQDVKNQLNIQ